MAGSICFLCVHVTLYNHLSADHIIEDITRGNKSLEVPIVEVGEAPAHELRTMFRDISDMEVEDRWLNVYAQSSGYCAGYLMQRADTVRNLSGKLWKEGKPGFAITSEDLVLSIPRGYLRRNKELPVMTISTSLAMRFAQLYDDLPPLLQFFTKVLHVATRRGLFKLPRSIMWETLNDLIADGVDGGEMAIVLDEMTEMHLVAIAEENGEEVLSFRTPALGDVAMDVCTPLQIRTISKALVDRLGPISSKSFKVALVLADLHMVLEQRAQAQRFWREGYHAFLEETQLWPTSEINLWKEMIDDEIESAGYKASEILGTSFFYPVVDKRSVGIELPLLKVYIPPVAFGPMGHSLSVICRNIFHEFGIFHGAKDQDSDRLLRATATATERYLKEMEVVDQFLAQHGLATPVAHQEGERACIQYISSPAESDRGVVAKARQVLNSYIPFFVESRLKKLRDLVDEFRQQTVVPEVVQSSPTALRRAYEALQSSQCKNDAAQEALLIMASMNWKPRDIPEYLPSRHYQTVARLRNAVLRRLDESELAVLIHQQSVCDLEAFLIVTPLLYSAPEVNDLLYHRPLCSA